MITFLLERRLFGYCLPDRKVAHKISRNAACSEERMVVKRIL